MSRRLGQPTSAGAALAQLDIGPTPRPRQAPQDEARDAARQRWVLDTAGVIAAHHGTMGEATAVAWAQILATHCPDMGGTADAPLLPPAYARWHPTEILAASQAWCAAGARPALGELVSALRVQREARLEDARRRTTRQLTAGSPEGLAAQQERRAVEASVGCELIQEMVAGRVSIDGVVMGRAEASPHMADEQRRRVAARMEIYEQRG